MDEKKFLKELKDHYRASFLSKESRTGLGEFRDIVKALCVSTSAIPPVAIGVSQAFNLTAAVSFPGAIGFVAAAAVNFIVDRAVSSSVKRRVERKMERAIESGDLLEDYVSRVLAFDSTVSSAALAEARQVMKKFKPAPM